VLEEFTYKGRLKNSEVSLFIMLKLLFYPPTPSQPILCHYRLPSANSEETSFLRVMFLLGTRSVYQSCSALPVNSR